MVFCPKCSSEKCVKDGKVKGRQRYRCKSCGIDIPFNIVAKALR